MDSRELVIKKLWETMVLLKVPEVYYSNMPNKNTLYLVNRNTPCVLCRKLFNESGNLDDYVHRVNEICIAQSKTVYPFTQYKNTLVIDSSQW